MDSGEINIINTYAQLPKEFFQKVNPTKVKSPSAVAWNSDLAKFLNLGSSVDFNWTPAQLNDFFSGNKIIPGSQPIAMAYSGHQFGYFNPTLGDGRAHLLGELKAQDNKLYDIQLKGSGRTMYSRSGDGRSPLGPAIREYVVSEAMNSLESQQLEA